MIDTCARVERYFVESLPLHVEDEEARILPRLEGRSAEVDQALARMHGAHPQHQQAVDALIAASSAVRAAPRDAASRAALHDAADALADILLPHLVLELEEREHTISPRVNRDVGRDS